MKCAVNELEPKLLVAIDGLRNKLDDSTWEWEVDGMECVGSIAVEPLRKC